MSATQNNLVSAIISGIFCLVTFATLRFYVDWFTSSQLATIFAGFVSSWIFLFAITAISNIEMLIFGPDFQAKFLPEIAFCLILAIAGAAVVHRVTATTCVLFSMIGLFFINRVSNKHHNKPMVTETVPNRRGGGKKHKLN